MTLQTLKMLLIMFFLAAALLNLINYAHTPAKINEKLLAPRMRLLHRRPHNKRFFTRKRVTRSVNWSALLLCTNSKDEEYPMNASMSQSSPIISFLADYKEQTIMCPLKPTGLGPISVNETEVELESVEKLYPEVQQGGIYIPPNCTARHKVAIIIPYRDRLQHLAIFLRHMHPFLMTQQVEYGIYVVEQHGNSEFNRAKLLNVGFVESQKLKVGGWQCFVFHDIDLLPLDSRNMYSCPRQPRHMSASIDKLNFKVSNVGYHIARYKMSIARYAMLGHKKSAPNQKRYHLLSKTRKLFQKDGLSTLEYKIVKVTRNHLYTHLLANIDERSWWSYCANLLFGDE